VILCEYVSGDEGGGTAKQSEKKQIEESQAIRHTRGELVD